MSDLFPPTLDDQIGAVERECKLRRQVYPRRVADGKMTAALAEKQTALMDAVLETLKALKHKGR